MQSIGTWWLWGSFILFVFIVITIDIILLNRKESHTMTVKEAGSWVFIWFMAAMIFNALLWWYVRQVAGPELAYQKALEFFTGYIIEESLSVDNMFVFLMIFSYLSVPAEFQRRVLLFGVLGAIFFRLTLILVGTWLISRVHWVFYLFGLFILVTGIKMLILREKNDLKDNFLLNWLRNHLRITHEYHNEHFFIKKNVLWYATPLFLALMLIEFSDLIFALDSIPAILAITDDPFIIFTSNIFAILGLRALYFLLVHMANRFYLLKYGVALILMFIGIKMLLHAWIKIPILLTLCVILTILATTVILSLLLPRKKTWPPRMSKN